MKKLIILSLIALLASGMVFAQVTVSGQIEYGVLSDFDNAPGQHWDNLLIATGKIDDFNTAWVRFRMRQSKDGSYNNAGLEVSDAPLIDRAYVSTNMSGALGLSGLKWTSINGFNWTQTQAFINKVSPYAVSRVSRIADGGGKVAALRNTFTFDALNLGVVVFPGDNSAGKGGYFFEAYSTLPAGGGKLDVELNYGTTTGEAFDLANVTGAAVYTAGPLGVGFNFNYDLDGDAAVAYRYGVAASYALPVASVKAGLVGYDGSEVNAAEAQLLLPLGKQFTVEVGTVLGLDSDVWTDSLQELDANLQIKAGKNLVRVGYLMISEDNGVNSLINGELSRIGRGASKVEKGGVYFEVSVPY